MIYRKLRKLEDHKRDIQSLIIAAYSSNADPDVVSIRVNDLQHDLYQVEKEIELEEIFVKFKWGLVAFVVCSIVCIIITLIKKGL